MRAWKGIKEKDPNDPNSFFFIAGLHGAPFRGEGATDSRWWGGYCNHGNVLFLTWHRAYLLTLERAL
jgi:tyrosinase